jgi:type IV pilus assembly protein PilY1
MWYLFIFLGGIMFSKIKKTALVMAVISAALLSAGVANAGAIITNGTVTLGVNTTGELNVGGGTLSSQGTTTNVGLRYNATNAESTADGCLCEGWGVGLKSAGLAGYANRSVGSGGLSLVSFTSTANTAVSVVQVGTSLLVTHNYHPSASGNLYQVDVSIKNISGAAFAAGDLVYRRVMDWDIEPTAFSEYVTIDGVPGALGLANGNNIRATSDNGFATSNPLVAGGSRYCPPNANFTDCGPSDHGALFDFEFEALVAGATRNFVTYYGAAGNETDALNALSLVGAGLYSLGQSSTPGGHTTGAPNTFMFGFGGKGGILTPPPSDVPEPGSLALAGLGMLSLLAMRRKTN